MEQISFLKNISKKSVFTLLISALFCCVLVANAIIPTYSFLFSALLIIVFLFCKSDFVKNKLFLCYIIPFLLLIIIGFISSLIFNQSLSNRDYFRDIFYLAQNCIFYVAGLFMGLFNKRMTRSLKYSLYISSLIILILNWLFILINRDFSFGSIRTFSLNGLETTILSAFFLAFDLFKKNKTKAKGELVFLIGVFSAICLNFIFSFSRVGLILIMFFLLLLMIVKKNAKLIISFIICVTLFVIFSIVSITNEIPLLSTYFRKLFTSFEEMSINHDWAIDYERTRYWRGFEIYSAISVLSQSPFEKVVFGHGFGFSTPLVFAHPLGTTVYINLPIMHNAYLTMLIKYGLLGLLLYFVSLITPFILSINKRDKSENQIVALTLFGYILFAPFFVTSILSSCAFGSTVCLFGLLASVNKKHKNDVSDQGFFEIFI